MQKRVLLAFALSLLIRPTNLSAASLSGGPLPVPVPTPSPTPTVAPIVTPAPVTTPVVTPAPVVEFKVQIAPLSNLTAQLLQSATFYSQGVVLPYDTVYSLGPKSDAGYTLTFKFQANSLIVPPVPPEFNVGDFADPYGASTPVRMTPAPPGFHWAGINSDVAPFLVKDDGDKVAYSPPGGYGQFDAGYTFPSDSNGWVKTTESAQNNRIVDFLKGQGLDVTQSLGFDFGTAGGDTGESSNSGQTASKPVLWFDMGIDTISGPKQPRPDVLATVSPDSQVNSTNSDGSTTDSGGSGSGTRGGTGGGVPDVGEGGIGMPTGDNTGELAAGDKNKTYTTADGTELTLKPNGDLVTGTGKGERLKYWRGPDGEWTNGASNSKFTIVLSLDGKVTITQKAAQAPPSAFTADMTGATDIKVKLVGQAVLQPAKMSRDGQTIKVGDKEYNASNFDQVNGVYSYRDAPPQTTGLPRNQTGGGQPGGGQPPPGQPGGLTGPQAKLVEMYDANFPGNPDKLSPLEKVNWVQTHHGYVPSPLTPQQMNTMPND